MDKLMLPSLALYVGQSIGTPFMITNAADWPMLLATFSLAGGVITFLLTLLIGAVAYLGKNVTQRLDTIDQKMSDKFTHVYDKLDKKVDK